MDTGIVVRRARVGAVSAVVPPVNVYEEWLDEVKRSMMKGGNLHLSAAIYRRVAVLRRLGDSWAEIGRCCGIRSGSNVKAAWSRLPDHLR